MRGGALLVFGVGGVVAGAGLGDHNNNRTGGSGSGNDDLPKNHHLLVLSHQSNKKHIYPTFFPPPSPSPSSSTTNTHRSVCCLKTASGGVIRGIEDSRCFGDDNEDENLTTTTTTATKRAPFIGFDLDPSITILATYEEENTDDNPNIAGLTYPIGPGKIALWAPNLEMPLVDDVENDTLRLDLLKTTLESLSLTPSNPDITTNINIKTGRSLPQFLTSNIPSIVSGIADTLALVGTGDEVPRRGVLKDENDTFVFHRFGDGDVGVLFLESGGVAAPTPTGTPTGTGTPREQPKHIILCTDTLPTREHTPLFDLELYYESLAECRVDQGCVGAAQEEEEEGEGEGEGKGTWGMGEVLLYGEVVTSTQSLFDK